MEITLLVDSSFCKDSYVLFLGNLLSFTISLTVLGPSFASAMYALDSYSLSPNFF